MDRALSAVGQTEERLRLALDAAGLGWWHVDLTTGGLEWNDRFEELTGLSRERPMDFESSLAFVHPDDLARVKAAVGAATRTVNPEPYAVDYRSRLADGGYRWLHSRGQTYFEAGRPARFVGTVADIDERKRADESRSELEARYETLVNSLDSGFCVVRPLFGAGRDESATDYRFLEVNPVFEAQTGLRDAVGRTIRELVPDIEPFWERLYGEVALTGVPQRREQHEAAMGRTFEVYAFRLGAAGTDMVGVLFADVTARRRAEEETTVANERNIAILESITDGFYSLDRAWRFSYVNREAERLLGRSDLVGKVLWEEYPGFRDVPFGQAYLRIAAGGPSESVTAFYPEHDRWYEVHASPSEEGVTVYFRDAGERVRHEQEREELLSQVQAERRKLELAYAESPAFVAILRGPDLVFEYVNEPYYSVVGHREILGKPLVEALPEMTDQAFPDLLRNVMATGERWESPDVAAKLQRKRGGPLEERSMSLRYLPIREPDGTISGVYAHGIDITERKQAEEELRAAHARTSDVLESLSDGFFALDAEWRFTYMNREAEQILDLRAEEVHGRTIWSVYPGLETTEFGASYHRAFQEQVSQSATLYYPEHDRWYEIKVSPTSVGVSVYFRNATDRVRNDEERERLLAQVETERRKLELAYAESPAFVAAFRGRDLVFEYVNEPYQRIIGHRDVVGKPLLEALPELVDQPFADILRGVMESGEDLDIPEIAAYIQAKPGGPREEVWIHIRYRPMREADGTITGVYAHGIDITEAVVARRTLSARAEETALGSRRKDEFLATLAHELRNPLAPIRLSTELMDLLEPSDPEFAEAREVIKRQVDHMVRLVDDLLDVSRVARGKIELRWARVDLAGVVTAAVETSRPLIENGRHALLVDLPSEPIHVFGDDTRLAQILANLLNNAAKYTLPGGHIAVNVAKENGGAVVRVRDDGVGISPEMLPHIWDMFAQAEVHLEKSQGGLGIGLTLVRRLVEMHGGTIEAQSEGPGRGSEFTLRLPAIKGASVIEPAVPEPVGISRPRRVLVVDDNVDGAWTLRGLLETMGHEVRVAHTGGEALASTVDFVPEVVLLDLGLPDFPGYEVARRFRADPRLKSTRLVAQTGWGREEDRALGRDAGFDDHLVKPLARADLERVFARLD